MLEFKENIIEEIIHTWTYIFECDFSNLSDAGEFFRMVDDTF
jgi:hypothetical protein